MQSADAGEGLPAEAGPVAPPDRFALAAAAVTAVLSFSPLADAPGSVFIVGTCLFWGTFVAMRARQDRSIFRRWGFRSDNLPQASAAAVAVFVVGVAGLAVAGRWLHGSLSFPAHALLLFLVYPVWGWVQQMLVLGIVAGNLERLGLRHRGALILVVAALFGLLHAGNLRLAAATFLLELVLVPLYFRWRNLWPLGVLHGWLGGLFYLWVENRDLWIERFG